MEREFIDNHPDDEIEIDLRELLFEFKKKILIILLSAVIGGGLGLFVSKVILTPMFTSTSMIYVISKETTLTSLADLNLGSKLTEDYKVLVTSRTVMEDVIEELSLPMNYRQLRSKISLENPRDTRILRINVMDKDPKMAKEITDAVANASSNYIADIMELNPPKIIEYGEVANTKTGPKTGRNTVLAALLSVIAIMALITLNVITDDTIKTEDDIEESFGIPVIAVIPEVKVYDRELENNAEKCKAGKSRKRGK